jgi:poly-gamma-glutamate synthesis protein (capsule biosynthesis protein)
VGKIAIMGDIVPGGVLHYRKLVIAPALRDYLWAFDLRVATFESALGDGSTPSSEKTNIIYSPDATADLLHRLQIDVVSLANNHVFDLSDEGFFHTLALLDSMGIQHCGAGKNLEEARKPVIVKVNQQRYGFLAYCHPTNFYLGTVREATESQPGVAPMRLPMMIEDIRRLKQQCDKVLLLMHWGIEYTWLIMPESQQIAKELIAAGADGIFGSHSHRVQTYYTIQQKPVFFSLGNCIFPNFIMEPPRTIAYPQDIVGEEVNRLPATLKYSEVKKRIVRVWPFLSRIGMIAEYSDQHPARFRTRYVRVSADNRSLGLVAHVFGSAMDFWLSLLGLVEKTSLYPLIYRKIFHLN